MRENLKKLKKEHISVSSAAIMVIIAVLMISCSFLALYAPPTAATETLTASATLGASDLTFTQPAPSVTPLPTLGVGSTFIRPADDAVMVYIPDGEFIMGSNDAGSDERPEHIVHLIDYWIDKTEVTNDMYQKCLDEHACVNPGTSDRDANYDEHPVASVPWVDAKNYCVWAGVRLPTEAEWEKAARGTDGRNYPWGNELDVTKYYVDPKPKLFSSLQKPVGSYPSGESPYGVLDMTGSIFEWVNDIYSPIYYETSPRSNPIGPSTDNGEHVVRGGNYFDHDFRVFVRSGPATANITGPVVNDNVGFRCVMETAP